MDTRQAMSDKPCGHEQGLRYNGCRSCYWWHDATIKGASFRARFQKQVVRKPTRGSDPCVYRKPETGQTVQCGGCKGKVSLKVYGCALHGNCTLEKPYPGVKCCAGCVEHQVEGRELLPGIMDPLPDPEAPARPDGWACLPEVRTRHVDALAKLLEMPLPPPQGLRGDGVVICGGGSYWPGIVVAVRMLRSFSALPVQIWHRGADEHVEPEDLADVPGVSFHDASRVWPRPRVVRGWETKSVAILHCTFRRVLFLDADAYCVSDPIPLFDLAEQYRLVFWVDLPHTRGNVRFHWYGIDQGQGDTVPMVQGGQLVINKELFWRELVIFYWLNQHSDYSYYYPRATRGGPDAPKINYQEQRHGYGDQDTWKTALALTGGTYLSLGPAPWRHPAFVCEYQGKAMVVHRCQGKILWGGRDLRTTHLPGDALVNQHLDRYVKNNNDATKVFTGIYRRGVWGPDESSGAGSKAREAGPYLRIINDWLKSNRTESLVDLGCGDGGIAGQLVCEKVVGVDCYKPHVAKLTAVHGRPALLLDLDKQREALPKADVALMKDVLHHWPSKLVKEWLKWAQVCRKWKSLILTSDCNQATDGQDCPLGGYRALSRTMEPLREFGLVEVTKYLHKAVLLMVCDQDD